MMIREVLSGGKQMDEHVRALTLSIAGIVIGIVEQGTRERTFRPVQPLLTHLSLVGGLMFYFATARFREHLVSEGKLPTTSAEDYVQHMQDLVTRGLAAVPGPLENGG